MESLIVFWFRRDLRLSDNAGLYHALKTASEQGVRVLPLFIFDRTILDELPSKRDRRVEFIHHALTDVQKELQTYHSSLIVRYGFPIEVWEQLLREYRIQAVFTNHDYEPYSTRRDEAVGKLLAAHGVEFQTFKDTVIFEKNEVLTADDRPYTVFTPYSRKWKAQIADSHTRAYSVNEYGSAFWQPLENYSIPALQEMGFEPTGEAFPPKEARTDIIRTYHQTRFPCTAGYDASFGASALRHGEHS